MITNNKGRAGRHQATPNTSDNSYIIRILLGMQTFITTLAVWGWIPRRWVDWMVRRGGRNG